MSWPNRRPIDPLPPPDGAFERMLKTAAGRRRQRVRTVVSSAAALALVAGGAFALGSSLGPDNQLSSTVASDDSPTHASASATASSSPSRRPHKKPTKTPTASASAKPPAPSASTAAPPVTLRGHVTDSVGNPIAGILVQPGVAGSAGFVPGGAGVATTDANGDFTIPCPRAPVYLSTWPLNQARTATSTGEGWAPAFFGQPLGTTSPVVPVCGQQRRTTALGGGATLTGVVQTVGSCPRATFPVWVWLNGNRDRTVRLSGLHAGDPFTFSGLPAGTHRLGARGLTTALDLAVGAVTTHDATFTCPGGPTPSGSPTATPDPSPTTTTPPPPLPPDPSPSSSTSPPPVP